MNQFRPPSLISFLLRSFRSTTPSSPGVRVSELLRKSLLENQMLRETTKLRSESIDVCPFSSVLFSIRYYESNESLYFLFIIAYSLSVMANRMNIDVFLIHYCLFAIRYGQSNEYRCISYSLLHIRYPLCNRMNIDVFLIHYCLFAIRYGNSLLVVLAVAISVIANRVWAS